MYNESSRLIRLARALCPGNNPVFLPITSLICRRTNKIYDTPQVRRTTTAVR